MEKHIPNTKVLFERNIRQGRLDFTTNLAEGIKGAKIIFLALPTPPGEDGSADLKYVLKVAEDLGPLLDEYAVIVDKSSKINNRHRRNQYCKKLMARK